LQQQICQKDFELEQHKKTGAQPSQTIPATAQQPSPVITSNNSGVFHEINSIKATLIDIQDQQQKISMVVNYLYNKIKTQDMYWLNHSSFNPYLGPYEFMTQANISINYNRCINFPKISFSYNSKVYFYISKLVN